MRERHPKVAWRDVVGTRTILAHAYFHIDGSVISSVVIEDIPRLRDQLIAVDRTFEDDHGH